MRFNAVLKIGKERELLCLISLEERGNSMDRLIEALSREDENNQPQSLF